jgi:hypothetical protein
MFVFERVNHRLRVRVPGVGVGVGVGAGLVLGVMVAFRIRVEVQALEYINSCLFLNKWNHLLQRGDV